MKRLCVCLLPSLVYYLLSFSVASQSQWSKCIKTNGPESVLLSKNKEEYLSFKLFFFILLLSYRTYFASCNPFFLSSSNVGVTRQQLQTCDFIEYEALLWTEYKKVLIFRFVYSG